MHSFHPLDLDSFFFFLSLSPFLPSFFFSSDLLPAVTQQWWTAIYTDDSINILEKYIRLFYIFTSVPYVPLVILFFSSRTLLLLFFFFNVTGNRTREHKSEQNGRYPFNQDSFITWSNILVNFSPTFLRFLPFFPPLPLSSFFPL